MGLMKRRQMLLMMQKIDSNLFNINATFQNPSSTTGSNTTKRIFTNGTHCIGTSWSNWFTPGNVNSYSISGTTLTVNTKAGYGVGFAISVDEGHTYHLSGTTTNVTTNACFYALDGTYISGINADSNGSDITAPTNAVMIVLTFRSKTDNANGSISDVEFKKVS